MGLSNIDNEFFSFEIFESESNFISGRTLPG